MHSKFRQDSLSIKHSEASGTFRAQPQPLLKPDKLTVTLLVMVVRHIVRHGILRRVTSVFAVQKPPSTHRLVSTRMAIKALGAGTRDTLIISTDQGISAVRIQNTLTADRTLMAQYAVVIAPPASAS